MTTNGEAKRNLLSNEMASRIFKGVMQRMVDAQLDTVETLTFFAWLQEAALTQCISIISEDMSRDAREAGPEAVERSLTEIPHKIMQLIRLVARLQAKGVASSIERFVEGCREMGVEVTFEGNDVKVEVVPPLPAEEI